VTVVKAGIRSVLTVPLISGGLGIGSIGLYRRELRPFTADEIALVQTFAEQAVIAIENVRQFKLLEARTQEIQALNESLEVRVDEQVGELERMGRLKQFLSPAVADTLVNSSDETMLASHRALIATLFCDIRGFTAFCETAEPEETIEVLQTYHEEMGNLISAHGGGIDKRMGDGIMVIFNDPLPCEDPAGDAVRLAVAMRERMVGLCKKWKRLGHRLGFGVGISFGYATIGMVGSEGRYDYTASGTSVNLAARLSDRAEDGEILLSPRAYTAVEDDFHAESSGEVSLKGIREPVEVFRLMDAADVDAQD
jgi:class 3 adenylate cyclase